MDKLTVIDGQVAYQGEKLGSGLIADYNELKLLTEKDGVTHMETPHRIDMLFAAGDKVVGVESKKPSDLVTSFNSRRLARQFRTLLSAVDIPVLLKRGVWPEEIMTYERDGTSKRGKPVWWHHDAPPYFTHRSRRSLKRLWQELAKWQMAGAIVLEGPGPDHMVPKFLMDMVPVLSEERVVRQAIGGQDGSKKSEDEWAMLRAVPGIGEASITKIKDAFEFPVDAIHSFIESIDRGDAPWPEVKVSKRVKENVKEALYGREATH